MIFAQVLGAVDCMDPNVDDLDKADAGCFKASMEAAAGKGPGVAPHVSTKTTPMTKTLLIGGGLLLAGLFVGALAMGSK